jgi:metallo-beta-lactamase family protein
MTWLKEFETTPKRIYLVHGEPGAQDALRLKIKDELGRAAKILREDHKEFLFSTDECNFQPINDADYNNHNV